eukprot:6299616-Amphidinium_carterae.1
MGKPPKEVNFENATVADYYLSLSWSAARLSHGWIRCICHRERLLLSLDTELVQRIVLAALARFCVVFFSRRSEVNDASCPQSVSFVEAANFAIGLCNSQLV